MRLTTICEALMQLRQAQRAQIYLSYGHGIQNGQRSLLTAGLFDWSRFYDQRKDIDRALQKIYSGITG